MKRVAISNNALENTINQGADKLSLIILHYIKLLFVVSKRFVFFLLLFKKVYSII